MEIAAPAALPFRLGRRFSFAQKLVLTALLVTLADHLFFFQRIGATLGIFAAALTAALLLATPAIGKSRHALAAAAFALLYALLLADDPSVLAVALFGLAATLAVLLPRTRGFDDGWRWAQRLLFHLILSILGPLMDWGRRRRARRRVGPARLGRLVPVLILPVVGSLVFLALFSAANPIIESAFARVDLAVLIGGFSIVRLFFWAAMVVVVWSLLRPARVLLSPVRVRAASEPLPGAGTLSIGLSLLAFNTVFVLQNGLDIAFLWSGAALPEGMTLAEYAHRGAYPLIATALLAALFVLIALRPGSETAQSKPIRCLVYLWIGQNIFLVASTMLRTADYIEAYSLTRLRIAALVWMALVALGLLLICIRIWREKSAAWLINVNFGAALLALTACSAIDLGAVAAAWNVRHAREVGGRGAGLDYCYLWSLRSSALLPLVEMESRRSRPMCARRCSGCATWPWTGSRRARRTGTAGRSAARGASARLTAASPPAICPASPPAGGGAALTARPGGCEMRAMSHKILIVDDDPHIRQLLAFALGKAGMKTVEAGDGEAALREVERERPDLVVLDINMPRMDGLEVCRRLRSEGDLPILFLSSRDDEIDRVLGLELGGDDYVVKPFSPREVVARVGAILKRGARPAAEAGAKTAVTHNKLRLDPEAWEARWDGAEVPVTVTEFQLLLLLASLPSKVFSRDAIIDRLHGPGFAITDRTIDSHIRNVRHKFAAAGAEDLIETRPGVGYRIGRCFGGPA